MTVSVVIPAFRRTFLRQAMASVLTQGFEDFELIIGDDNPGDEVVEVVHRFKDPRIRHMRTTGAVGALENCRMLWSVASRPRLKYLFDDDLLMPNALVEMVDALDAHPTASFCFSNRYIIDTAGRVTREAINTPVGRVAVIGHDGLTGAMLPKINNPVGEFSNVLINRASGVDFADVDSYRGFEIQMLGDVAFYLNATRKGPAVQIGKTLAAFRRHAQQNSTPSYNARFSRGLCEWEIFLRSEFDNDRLTQEQALAGAQRLENAYASWRPRLDELRHVQPALEDFRSALQAGRRPQGITAEFQAGLAALTAHTNERWLADRPAAAEPSQAG